MGRRGVEVGEREVVITEGPITLRWQQGCARCEGDGHEDITFQPLTHPIVRDDLIVGTHWAPCPTNGEPIIMVSMSK